MKAMFLAAAGATLGLVNAPDLAPPGMHLVRNEVVVDWPDTLGAVRFVVAPAATTSRHQPLVRGAPFPVGRGPFKRARIYAVPADASDLPATEEDWAKRGWPSTLMWSKLVHAVGAVDPTRVVRTELRIEAVEADTIRVRKVGEQRLDANGNPVVSGALAPALAACAGIALLVGFARRRREGKA